MAQPQAATKDYRTPVFACLERFANADAGSTESLPYQLCKQWFDEVYIPSNRYLDAIKGNLSAEAVQAFRSQFCSDELEALERFHHFLELRLEMVRKTEHGAVLHHSRLWEHIRKDAKNTLGLLLENLDELPPA